MFIDKTNEIQLIFLSIKQYGSNDRDLEHLAKIFDDCKADITQYFSLDDPDHIYLRIPIAKMLGKRKHLNSKEIHILFEMLQDANWSFFIDAVESLSRVNREVLIGYIQKYLLIANKQKDFMWIAGIKILMEKLRINFPDNDSTFITILDKADF